MTQTLMPGFYGAIYEKVIFLDVDGVLNCVDSFKACNLRNEEYKKNLIKNGDKIDLSIEMMVRDVGGLWQPSIDELTRIQKETDCSIVISSTWRLRDGMYNRLINHLSKFIPKTAFVGRTERLDGKPRGDEIKEWMSQAAVIVGRYVIIDDDNDMLDEQQEFYIKTSVFDGGLKAEHADKAIKILNKVY